MLGFRDPIPRFPSGLCPGPGVGMVSARLPRARGQESRADGNQEGAWRVPEPGMMEGWSCESAMEFVTRLLRVLVMAHPDTPCQAPSLPGSPIPALPPLGSQFHHPLTLLPSLGSPRQNPQSLTSPFPWVEPSQEKLELEGIWSPEGCGESPECRDLRLHSINPAETMARLHLHYCCLLQKRRGRESSPGWVSSTGSCSRDRPLPSPLPRLRESGIGDPGAP